MQLRNIVAMLGLILVTSNVQAVDVVIGNGASAPASPPSNPTNVVIGDTAITTATNGDSVVIGANATSSGNASIAIGAASTAGGSQFNMAVGRLATIAVGANVNSSLAIGDGAQIREGSGGTLTAGATAIGASSIANQSNTVSFGIDAATGAGMGYPTGLQRRLVNVANGVANTDAVTVGQLNAAIAGVAGGTTDQVARDAAAAAQLTADNAGVSAATAQATADAATVTANSADTKASTAINAVNTITPRVNALETKINGFDGRIGGLETRMDKVEVGVASALAMGAANSNAASAASRSEKGRAIGIGASVFAGRSVTAVSYASNFGFGTVTAAASLSGSPSVQVGAGFAF